MSVNRSKKRKDQPEGLEAISFCNWSNFACSFCRSRSSCLLAISISRSLSERPSSLDFIHYIIYQLTDQDRPEIWKMIKKKYINIVKNRIIIDTVSKQDVNIDANHLRSSAPRTSVSSMIDRLVVGKTSKSLASREWCCRDDAELCWRWDSDIRKGTHTDNLALIWSGERFSGWIISYNERILTLHTTNDAAWPNEDKKSPKRQKRQKKKDRWQKGFRKRLMDSFHRSRR